MKRTKIVILSDVHMSNGAEYSWFNTDNADRVTAILNMIAHNNKVKELVFLGDIFDLWLYPLEKTPLTINGIINTWDNTVIQALRNCVANLPKVYYLPGNHDITVRREDLIKICSDGKTLEWITPDDYNNKYIVNDKKLLHIEHGNSVDIFNAPYDDSDGLYGLPIGYFLTRMYTTTHDQIKSLKYSSDKHRKIIKKIKDYTVKELKKKFIKHHQDYSKTKDLIIGELFIKSIIGVQKMIASRYGKTLTDDMVIQFPEPEKNVTIGTLKKHYHGLFEKWYKKWGIRMLKCILTSLYPDGLDWYAKDLLHKHRCKVVVMGHTHKCELNSLGKKGYINSGSWCELNNNKGASYVEVEIHSHDIDISLWQWVTPHPKKIGSRTVRI